MGVGSGQTKTAEKKEDTDESNKKEMSTTKTKVEADEESKIPSEEDDSNDIVSIKEKVAGVSIEKDNVSKEIGSDQSQNVEKRGNADESNKKEMSTTKTEVEADDKSKIPSDEDHLNDMVSIKEKEVEKDCANEEIGSDPTQNAEKRDDTDKSSKEKEAQASVEKEAMVSVEKDAVNEEISSGLTQSTEKKGDINTSSKKEMSITKNEVEADDELRICSDEDVIEPGVLHIVVVEGKELVNKDFIGKSDPYVKIIFNKQEFQSKKV